MTTRVPFPHSIVLSVLTLTIFSTSVSAFAFGFAPAKPGNGRLANRNTRVDRIDRVSADYDCYSLIQPEPIRSTDRPQVNAGELQAVEAIIAANWASTAQMDAVAFYTTPDCREDSKALIVRWFNDKTLPQMSYLAAGFEGNRIPKRLTAYRPILIPPGPASEEDYELASVDFETAVLQNPGLMKPGSVFAPRTTRRTSVTYCNGLIRFAAFGEKSIRALGGIAKEYFQEHPDAIEVPDNQHFADWLPKREADWPELEELFDKQLQQLLTGVTSPQPRARAGEVILTPGSFRCNRLEKRAYIDTRPVSTGINMLGNPIEEETEVVQHDEVVLDSDQTNLTSAQRGTGRNNLQDEDDVQYGDFRIPTDSESSEQAVSDTIFGSSRERPEGLNVNPNTGSMVLESVTATATSQGQRSEGQRRVGGRMGLRAKRQKEAELARSRPQTETEVNPEGQNADLDTDVAPVKVQVSQGNLDNGGFNVRRLDGSNAPTNSEYEDLRASQQRDNNLDPNDPRQKQILSVEDIDGLPPGGGTGADINRLRELVNLLKQRYFPSVPHEIRIPVPRRPQEADRQIPPLAQDIQIPPLAQSIQNSIEVSEQQPSDFLRSLNEIWQENGGQEPPLPGRSRNSNMLLQNLQPPAGK
ncbi:hypothetical protein TWF506_001590 [Arthrobotrys conoides]|uniref:Secreted protein n=1 Tax=Arthrobotrys conoides TaxID=74498 RepID=A0AAN8RY69_9PEZI